MEFDPVTKWLVRISSSIIIALGLILVFALPLLALKAVSIISLTHETIHTDFKDFITALLERL